VVFSFKGLIPATGLSKVKDLIPLLAWMGLGEALDSTYGLDIPAEK